MAENWWTRCNVFLSFTYVLCRLSNSALNQGMVGRLMISDSVRQLVVGNWYEAGLICFSPLFTPLFCAFQLASYLEMIALRL